MDNKVIVLILLMVFAIILALMVASNQISFVRIIESWAGTEYNPNSYLQIQILEPRPDTFWNVTYNTTTGVYEITIFLETNKLLYNWTPPITTNFPLYTEPIIMLCKNVTHDGHTFYIYKVILKTKHIYSFGDIISLMMKNDYQQILFFPVIVYTKNNSNREVTFNIQDIPSLIKILFYTTNTNLGSNANGEFSYGLWKYFKILGESPPYTFNLWSYTTYKIESIGLYPKEALPLLDNPDISPLYEAPTQPLLYVTDLYVKDNESNYYQLMYAGNSNSHFYVFAVKESPTPGNSTVAVFPVYNISFLGYSYYVYDIFYRSPPSILGVVLEYLHLGKFAKVYSGVKFVAKYDNITVPLNLTDVIPTWGGFELVMNAYLPSGIPETVIVNIDPLTLRINSYEVIGHNEFAGTPLLQHIAVSFGDYLVLFNKTSSGSYTAKLYKSANNLLVRDVVNPYESTGYVFDLLQQDNTIFISYYNLSAEAEIITSFDMWWKGSGTALLLKFLNTSDTQPEYLLGQNYNIEHIGNGWTALTFYDKYGNLDPVFLIFSDKNNSVYACEYNNKLAGGIPVSETPYYFSILYDLIIEYVENTGYINLIYNTTPITEILNNPDMFVCENANNKYVDLKNLYGSSRDVYVKLVYFNVKPTETIQNTTLATSTYNTTLTITEEPRTFSLYEIVNDTLFFVSSGSGNPTWIPGWFT